MMFQFFFSLMYSSVFKDFSIYIQKLGQLVIFFTYLGLSCFGSKKYQYNPWSKLDLLNFLYLGAVFIKLELNLSLTEAI